MDRVIRTVCACGSGGRRSSWDWAWCRQPRDRSSRGARRPQTPSSRDGTVDGSGPPALALMAVDFAIICPLVRPIGSVSRTCQSRRGFTPRFLRPRLARTPRRVANPSPPSGWIEDIHLPAVGHARYAKRAARRPPFQKRSWVTPFRTTGPSGWRTPRRRPRPRNEQRRHRGYPQDARSHHYRTP